ELGIVQFTKFADHVHSPWVVRYSSTCASGVYAVSFCFAVRKVTRNLRIAAGSVIGVTSKLVAVRGIAIASRLPAFAAELPPRPSGSDRKSTRLNSSHDQ